MAEAPNIIIDQWSCFMYNPLRCRDRCLLFVEWWPFFKLECGSSLQCHCMNLDFITNHNWQFVDTGACTMSLAWDFHDDISAISSHVALSESASVTDSRGWKGCRPALWWHGQRSARLLLTWARSVLPQELKGQRQHQHFKNTSKS